MHAYLPLHVSAQFTYLFTFECIFHVVGQFGENIFFSKLKCFYRLEIGTMHCNASLYISYTWHYLYILFQQNNLLLSNITCIQIGNSHTQTYAICANLKNFTGNLRNCWISVRSTSTSSLHQNVAHEQAWEYRLTIYRYANIVWFSKYRWNIVIAFFLAISHDI